MSRRAIKKYEQELEAKKLSKDAESEVNDEEVPNHPSPRPQGLFALLGDDQDEPESEGEKSDDDKNVSEQKAENFEDSSSNKAFTTSGQDLLEVAPDENMEQNEGEEQLKKKKRKKRKGKKRQDVPVNQDTDPDWIALNEAAKSAGGEGDEKPSGYIPSSYFSDHDGEDVREEAERIMRAIEAIVMKDGPNDVSALHSTSTNVTSKVLHVDPKLLNADSELKRLFGSRIIESERRAEEADSARVTRRRGRLGSRPQARRRVSLVSPRETWFGEAPGLIMVVDTEATNNNPDGIRYYRYVHEASYARVQEDYRIRVSTHDPNQLVELFSRCPYHVDTMLQLAEVYRQMGELDRAAEQVERCLYVLESSWNIGFKPYDGTCRLRFDVLENRALYLALFRYSQLLTRRGLHRTALEISKLLLNFDPERDPMGMLMLADSFALLSGEYEWIQDMYSTFDAVPIRYFPNFAASLAIAGESIRLGIGGIGNRGGSGKGKASGKSESSSKEAGNEDQSADDVLIDALLTFPMLLRPLLNAIKDESGVWAEHRLFDEAWYGAGYEDYGVLLRMCRVYAERSKLLWNSPSNKQMLMRCARAAGSLDTAAGTGIDPETGRSTSAFVSDVEKHPRVARCRALRAEAGEWLRESGLYREVQIADFADSTTNLPAELLAGDGADQAVGAAPPRQVTLGESALEFLQSLMPWREIRDAL